jgi:hypothetical protein
MVENTIILSVYKLNLLVGWACILANFITGGLTGMTFKFFNEEWLGGYSELRRRMYRLGHVALFALGTVNIMFYLTIKDIESFNNLLQFASWGFITGAITMPICCYLIPHFPKIKYLFYIPSISLIGAGTIIFYVFNII